MRPKHAKSRSQKPLTRAAAALTLTCMLSTATLPALAEGVQPEEAAQPTAESEVALYSENDAGIAVQASVNQVTAGAGENITQNGDVQNVGTSGNMSAVSAKDGGTITVNGKVDYDGGGYSGVYSEGKGSDVTINGNVTNTGNQTLGSTGVFTKDGGHATINGNVNADKSYAGIHSTGKDDFVHVTGNVTSESGAAGVAVRGGGTVKVDGNVTDTSTSKNICGIAAEGTERATITVGGDVSSDSTYGAHLINAKLDVGGSISGKSYGVSSSNSTIDVGKDVTGTNYGIVSDTSTITVDGSVSGSSYGIWSGGEAGNKEQITVEKDVSGNTGIKALGNTDITVKGDINGNSSGSYGVWTDNKKNVGASTVTVEGNVTGNAGVKMSGNATVRVGGNVTSNEYGAIIMGGADNTILIGNNITTKNDFISISAASATGTNNEIAIGGKIENADSNIEGTYLFVSTNADGSLNENNLPEFVVGEIEDFSKMDVVNSDGHSLSDEDQQKVLDNIKYIVRYAEKSEDGQAALTVTRSDGSAFEKDSSGTYEVAKKGEEITVKVETIPGWVAKILPGKDNTVRENADGSFTVTVVEGGGIDIRAVLEKIDTPTDPSDDTNGGSSASSAWLYVVGKDGNRVPYTQEQKSGVMVFTTAEETAALTGNLKALEELGVTAVQFVTPNKTSTFTVRTVCSAGGEDDVFVLAHDAAGATLFAGNAVHSEYLS